MWWVWRCIFWLLLKYICTPSALPNSIWGLELTSVAVLGWGICLLPSPPVRSHFRTILTINFCFLKCCNGWKSSWCPLPIWKPCCHQCLTLWQLCVVLKFHCCYIGLVISITIALALYFSAGGVLYPCYMQFPLHRHHLLCH